VVHALNTQEPTNISCSPSIMMSLLSHPDFSSDGYPSLKVVAMGADRVSKELVEQCKATFRPEKVANGWGMTEGIGILGSAFGDPPAWRENELSIGHVLPGAAIRVCEPETTEVVDRGMSGELHVSGPQVLAGYWAGSKTVQNDSFYRDGGRAWFKTGDAVVMDDAGNIFLTGRFKDLIIRGGENIHPGLIENCLNALPGIQVTTLRLITFLRLILPSLKLLASMIRSSAKRLQQSSASEKPRRKLLH
jgi:acyl-CoA synthetase (AMP-forming)/AMP-acid ligase II